ncbi:alpha-amylase family glycosyl hydrolase [Mycoplasmopsis cricetuli]|uniref:alpha-amylase family glycosyl hydrolase n=1 Tax=Mycoplasmopsis cricetuli TaxID=171283 RepID=UPI0004722525|nr:alpha-amylase family glycosyl hydrolase [Mycoplasmopsis cricetuli]
MKKNNLSKNFLKKIDQKYFYSKNDLGVTYSKEKIVIKLWQPIALGVNLLIFEDYNTNNFQSIKMKFANGIWSATLDFEYDQKYYQFEIKHQDNSKTVALDPYAKSMAPFNFLNDKLGRGYIFNWQKLIKKPRPLKNIFLNKNKTIIYELNIRDFTSLSNKNFKNKKGTFAAAIENNIFPYLKKLNFTHLQLLPIQATYTINEFELNILNKGKGNKENTNYNWGYDPHNYFSLNGNYSQNSLNPIVRINEFSNFVDQGHKNNIGIIIDVVFNHLMHNDILNNIFPGYYFRDNAKQYPVDQPPLATERKMVQKLIVDVLKYFILYFDVDGFRFDLSSFFDKQTHEYIAKELYKIKPTLILHGEAWPFSDLKFKNTYIKGYNDNNFQFAYFNDTVRDSITVNENNQKQKGLIINKNYHQFKRYISSIVGNIKKFNWPKNVIYSKNFYDLFSKNSDTNLGYISCHDNLTLWDKIITNAVGWTFEQIIESYRKALIMLATTQGRKLFLAGTELGQSKPCDNSGQDFDKCKLMLSKDFLKLKPDDFKVHPNSYKTTDYVNGIKWNNLNNLKIKKYIFNLIAQLNKFKLTYLHFNLNNENQINQAIKFIEVNYSKGVIVFEISINNQILAILHNFNNNTYEYLNYSNKEVIFSSKLNPVLSEQLLPFESKILKI